MPTAKPLHLRFWSHVDRLGNGCWEWQASTDSHGYGQFRVPGGIRRAHRLAWELANGEIPDGMNICHRCDNRRCCRVDHMFLGTQSDNIRDAVAKGRWPQGGSADRIRAEATP